jgi:carbonic anhydrase/acetyltransferase-like protein (isoleucine patch superfamily)
MGSALLGRVTIGENAELGSFSVLRADGHVVEVGSGFSIGRHSTVHISHEIYGAFIGHHVSVGSNSVVHACTVEDDCVVQDQVCVLDGALIGRGSVIAQGSVVSARAVMPTGHWCAGNPAVPLRPIDAAELAQLHQQTRAQARLANSLAAAARWIPTPAAAPGYVAATVTGAGELRMGEDSSLWFGCIVDAATHGVDIGAGTNVQDNSILRSSERALVIGADCTIGHNVLMHDCTIGDRVLLGMGSVLAPGTVVQDDVLLAAGSTTEPGQVLEGGWLWRGQPARPVVRLDPKKRQLMEQSALIYREYAKEFALQQKLALQPLP